jgi:hypothetical protein
MKIMKTGEKYEETKNQNCCDVKAIVDRCVGTRRKEGS